MKKFNLLFAVVVLLVVATFTSCMDNDDPKDRFQNWVTIETGYLGLSKYFLTDNSNVVLHPTNTNFDLEKTTIDRAIILYELANGEVFEEGKKEYKINVLDVVGMKTKAMLEKPIEASAGDTLRNDSIETFYSLYSYKNYIAVNTYLGYGTTAYIDMYQDKVKEDTLFLNYNLNTTQGGYKAYSYNSFFLPSKYELKEEGLEVPANDSIVIAVTAKVEQAYGKPAAKTYYTKHKLE